MSRLHPYAANASHRHLPERYGRELKTAMAQAPSNEFIKMLQARIKGGLDPDYVGELVCERIEGDWPYIFTHTSSLISRRGSRRSGRGSAAFGVERRRVDVFPRRARR